jgi:PTH1 family peptidyl-tRNA hydrolase
VATSVRVVVGLGTPGEEYVRTRHNAGFLVVDALAARLGVPFRRRGGSAEVADGRARERPFVLLKPMTYMNCSGEPMKAVARDLDLSLGDTLVVLDEFQLDLGRIRVRGDGSDGGHNGMKSVIAAFGTTEIPRLRLGIGPIPGRMPPEVFVLRPFKSDEREELDFAVVRAADAAADWIDGATVETLMNRYNVK